MIPLKRKRNHLKSKIEINFAKMDDNELASLKNWSNLVTIIFKVSNLNMTRKYDLKSMHENFKEKMIEFQKEIQERMNLSLSWFIKVSRTQGKTFHDSILQLSNITFVELTEIAGKYTKLRILYSKEYNKIQTAIYDCIKTHNKIIRRKTHL